TVTGPTRSYTLSLHDALPISPSRSSAARPARPCRERVRIRGGRPMPSPPRERSHGLARSFRRTSAVRRAPVGGEQGQGEQEAQQDRKSTRLNSSHVEISYAVF